MFLKEPLTFGFRPTHTMLTVRTLFLSYADYVVLVGQMPAIDRKVHRLHGARQTLEILQATGRRPLCELDLSDLHPKKK